MNKKIILGFVISLFAFAGSFAQTPEGVHMIRVGESAVATGCYLLSGQEQLTGQAFQQDALLTYKGYQYTVYYNDTRNTCIARRKLPLGEWHEIVLDHKNTADDAHNVISMGICANDGTIHLSYDHHNTTLHYRRSVVGLANDPENTKWSASNFGPDINYLEAEVTVPDVTYPRFINKPDGNLLFECRYKLSGDGDSYLREYDGETHTWSLIGRYVQGMDFTPDACAYINRMDYDKFGKLHVSWCWRDDFGGGSNHDISYAYSEDHGRTWKDSQGNTVALTEKINPTNSRTSGVCLRQGIASLKVVTIPYNRGYINQESQATDSKGRVHVLNSHIPKEGAAISDWNLSRKEARLHQRFRDTNGTWITNQVKNNGATVNSYCRSQIVIDAFDNAYVIANGAEVYAATDAGNYANWGLVSGVDKGRFCSEPQVDHTRLLSDGVLSFVYVGRDKKLVVIDYLLDNPNTPSGKGLHAACYADEEMTDLIKEIDDVVPGTSNALPLNAKKIRYSGTLETLYADQYTLYLVAQGPTTLYVNGEKLMEKTTGGSEVISAALPVCASHKQNIVIESGNVVSLSWSSGRTQQEIIPATSLYSEETLMDDSDNNYAYSPDIPEKTDLTSLFTNLVFDVTSGIDTVMFPISPSGDYTIEVKAKVLSAVGRGLDLDARALNGNGFRVSMDPESVKHTSPITQKTTLSTSDNTANTILRFAVQGKKVHFYQDGVYLKSFDVADWQGDLNADGTETTTPAYDNVNALAGWAGTTGNNSGKPSDYGWKSTGTTVWDVANGSTVGAVRFMDVTASSNPSHILNATGAKYAGRLMTVRWDGSQGTFILPVTLEAKTSYNFSTLYEWWNNGSAPTITVGMATSSDGSGLLNSASFNKATTKNRLYKDSFTFASGDAGTYYLTVQGSSGTMCAIGDLTLNKVLNIPRLIVGKNYTDGATNIFVSYVKYTEGAYAPGINETSLPEPVMKEALQMYPVNHSICINGLSSGATVAVYDISGKKVLGQSSISSNYISPVLHPGIYIVLVKSNDHLYRRKILL